MPTAWFLCPYKRRFNANVPGRYCPMNDFTREINRAAGHWAESEIDGNQAIVRVRAPDALLTSIGLVHPRLTDTEAQAAWTPTRPKPQFDVAGDKFRFDPSKPAATRSLADLVRAVPEQAPSIELTSLIGSWLALGFGLGWRVPYWLAVFLSLHVGAPNAFARQVAHAFFSQSGAFPTTSVLDNFNGTNGTALPSYSTNWEVLSTSWVDLKIQDNAVAGQDATGGNCWHANFGPASEAYITLSTDDDTTFTEFGVFARLVQTGGANTFDGYWAVVQAGATDGTRYGRLDNASETQLGSSTEQEFSSGDALGLEIIGSTLQTYRKASGGSWAALGGSTSDSTYSAAGRPGIYASSSAFRLDGFGAGTVFTWQQLVPSYIRAQVINRIHASGMKPPNRVS